MTKKILIAGGSGLIGKKLTEKLLGRGYTVAHLGRSRKPGKVPSFQWDPEQQTFDSESLHGVDTVVNLAGAGIADKRWTAQRKKIILESRTKSVALLAKMIENSDVQTVLGASAIGYYGSSETKTFDESDPAGTDFLASVVNAWEEAYAPVYRQGKRVVNFRIGIVLAKEGGALQEMLTPVRYFVGAPLGSGKQMMSWIHIDDLCEMFIRAIEHDDMRGVYNAVAPHSVSNKAMTYALAKAIGRPVLLPRVPAFVLKILLGEMASVVLTGSIVSSQKIQATGFRFTHLKPEPAISDLLNR